MQLFQTLSYASAFCTLLGTVQAAPYSKNVTLTGPVQFKVEGGPPKLNNHIVGLIPDPKNRTATLTVVANNTKPLVAEFDNGILWQVEKKAKGFHRTGATAALTNRTSPYGTQFMDLGFKVYNGSNVPSAQGDSQSGWYQFPDANSWDLYHNVITAPEGEGVITGFQACNNGSFWSIAYTDIIPQYNAEFKKCAHIGLTAVAPKT